MGEAGQRDIAYIYIHHWQILCSSYTELTWVGFEPATTEHHHWIPFRRSNRLSHQTMSSLRANFVQLIQFHRLFGVRSHFGCLPSSVAAFILFFIFFIYIRYCNCYIVWTPFNYRRLVLLKNHRMGDQD